MIVVEVTESTPEGLFHSVYKSWQRLLSVQMARLRSNGKYI